ncbi:MAG: glycosyltransferase [Deltaproteobacteria bacterium RBG_13_49_15]|nr:MAG: glycosyltransferase [Deltaproteobacteria bacterium RBG_13_49_15]
MRILNVNMSIDPVMGGGTAERTVQMSRFLTKAGMECTILTIDIGLSQERLESLEGTRIVALPCLHKRFYIPRFTNREIRNLIEEADIIHLMGHWTFINSLVHHFAVPLKKPYVVCPAGALPVFGRSKLLKAVYNRVSGRRMIQGASAHIAVTPDEVSQFQQYGVDPDKVTVIPNGIDDANYQSRDNEGFRSRYGLKDHPFILFLGRLNPIKGPDLLVEAFGCLKTRLQNHHLVLVGPDEGMLPALKEMARAKRIEDRIHFTGYLGGTDKSNACHAADLLVIPSRQEAMSIVVLEAGISGIPVVMTDRCGFHDIEDIEGGYIVPASTEGIKSGLLKMLQDPEKMGQMGRNLKTYVERHFLWDVIVHEYLDLYGRILGKAATVL